MGRGSRAALDSIANDPADGAAYGRIAAPYQFRNLHIADEGRNLLGSHEDGRGNGTAAVKVLSIGK